MAALVAGSRSGVRGLRHRRQRRGSSRRLQRAAGRLPVDGNRNYAEESVRWVSWYLGWPALALAGAALGC